MALFAAGKDWDYCQNAILVPGEILIDKIAYLCEGSRSLPAFFRPSAHPVSTAWGKQTAERFATEILTTSTSE